MYANVEGRFWRLNAPSAIRNSIEDGDTKLLQSRKMSPKSDFISIGRRRRPRLSLTHGIDGVGVEGGEERAARVHADRRRRRHAASRRLLLWWMLLLLLLVLLLLPHGRRCCRRRRCRRGRVQLHDEAGFAPRLLDGGQRRIALCVGTNKRRR